jgi:xanthine dehydrogenase accessory factor
MSEPNKPYQSDDAVLATALAWLDEGKGVALATVISTWGSAPRPAGSQIAVNGAGEFAGSVSGGCIEGAVIHAGLDAIQTGTSEVLEFGVSNSQAWEVGLACGGTIQIYVTPLDENRTTILKEIEAAAVNKTPLVWVSNLGTDESKIYQPGSDGNMADQSDPNLIEIVNRAVRSDKAQSIETDKGTLFVNPFNPPLRLFVVGAVHIAQPLVRMAGEVGYEITVIDPREAFASTERFPDHTLSHDWPDEALRGFGLDQRSAVVTLSHDPKIDDPALGEALGSNSFYIGSLGSKKTHAARLERLSGEGFSKEALSRIHGPIGLSIGAKSPSEIAVSILAEITDVLRRKTT